MSVLLATSRLNTWSTGGCFCRHTDSSESSSRCAPCPCKYARRYTCQLSLFTYAAFFRSFWYLQRNGIPFSNLILGFGNWPGLTDELLFKAQSVNFFTLILMQWGYAVDRPSKSLLLMCFYVRNLFATRGRKLSIFQHKPTSNPWVFAAATMALCIGIFFHYVPWL